jgi:predicted enzyme related to lactoylglutathione lyase
MGQPVVHWEFWSRDPKKLNEFYAKVFDWQVTHIPEMNYHLVDTGGSGGINGGVMTPQEGPWPGNMAVYIDVPDLTAYCERIRKAGGKVIVERMEVGNMGALSLFEDPDGRVVGMWQQAKNG